METVRFDAFDNFGSLRGPVVDPRLGDSLLDAAVVDVVKVIQDLHGERLLGIEDDQLVRVEVLLVHSGGGVHEVVTLFDDEARQLCRF